MKLLAPLALAMCLTGAPAALAQQEPGMIDTMRTMQYFLQKLSLSVDAGNRELADFYAHELEENIESAQQIEEYHGLAIADLTEAMLVPSFEKFEQALESDEAQATRQRLEDLVTACNACHQATGYEFIEVVLRKDNPYMQSFAPRD